MPSFEKAVKYLDVLTSISNNFLDGSLQENIVYVHLHKCGGTSITQAIKSCYHHLGSILDENTFHLNGQAASSAAQKIISQIDLSSETTAAYSDYLIAKFREDLLLYYMCQPNIKYIAGHFAFSNTAYQYFAKKYAFVTVLREPVKRWISAYFYNRYKKHQLEGEFSDFLKSDSAIKGGCLYVKSIGGLDKSGDYSSQKAIARAKENLHKFKVVGCLEYTPDFLNQFEKKFGKKLKIRRFNQSPKPKKIQQAVVTPEIEKKIREICQPDIEVYQYALENFVKKAT
ncbi:sulfotransferase family 2 domain-containing protein [Gloeocapsopsis crepidinum LEGE 06123]|uniref:Sulfotransferase family 2 domain-containing protein n=1 Tax=Gloeocapsopsis crepidinum LEGE 06123 TaxID=588587 RepID=A0ABR9UUL6_9CHRO|nr:sulfotransferase family 2 domain-containing protein [Gloeocapsopsis crepidinum]MBE9191003.1 sulfotransferase family 2 domain-containing protein [Gloeocapsopsis crepidinum LEGE 06123]